MTSLHYTLIALGIGLVGAVMLYNLWQEHRSRKQAERIFRPHERNEDMSLGDLPLHDTMPDTRIEPHIHLLDEDEEEPPTAPVSFAPVASEPRPLPVEPPAAQPGVPATDDPEPPASQGAQTLVPESPLDGEIEFIARLRYVQPAVVQFASLQDNLRRISKPIRMVGRREGGVWEPVTGHAARPYGTVELALLLADRAGPVSDAQLDAFCRRLYEFATDHGGAISCQDKAAAVERAKGLDAFCAEVDVVIGLNILPAVTGFSNQDVGDLAAQAGLVQGVDGTYSLRDDDGQLLFTLNDGATAAEEKAAHGVALLFDVPRVGHGLAAFDRMTELGLKLAERLGGRLVDDGGRPVSRASLERDRKSLETIYARMAARGIPAGGERALRLFA
ncbi:MAG: cell division protein ZipA C-terminal FtsZ-binding domain-containing protein [Gallionellaceae bacterium]|nr:cell division protein ZipA C-terminal FtsZ-binding domain-containing protein [Gallionellaceae bacterium]